MKRFSEQFHTKAQSVKLQAVERDTLKARLVSYMEYHPMPVSTPVPRKFAASQPLPFADTFKVLQIPTASIFRWSAAFSVLLLIMIPVLAEKTVPGDNLYAVKVRFNEEVRSSLTLDQHAKVEWETKRLNRRIAEARQLASEGKLTPEVEVQVVAAVREHTENVQKEIETLRVSDADGATLASIELNTTLELQSTSLQEEGKTTLAAAVSDAQSATMSTQLLVDVLNETISKQDDQPDAAIPSYDKIMARIEQNNTRSHELLTSIKFNDADPLKSGIDRRLQDVNRSIEQANALRSQDEVTASQLLINTLERTQKLIVLMSDIDVNRNVDLELVVPIILTVQEQDEHIAQLNIEINRRVEVLEALRPQMSVALADKVGFSITAAKQKQEEVKSDRSKITNHDFAKNTLTLLDDALGVVKAAGIDTFGVVTTSGEKEDSATTTASTTPALNTKDKVQ